MPRELLHLDESALGISWVLDEPMQRACHAINADGRIWFIDPIEVDDVVDRAAALGEPAGVLQLLDRHNRDNAAIAERLGIEHLNVPDEVSGSPFEAIEALRVPGWKETALWWPERRVLVVAEIVGTHPITNAGTGEVGVHPMLRLFTPKSIRGFDAEHLLTGHGPPFHGDVEAELDHAYSRSIKDIPRAAVNLFKSGR
jgi:hypothetical protein